MTHILPCAAPHELGALRDMLARIVLVHQGPREAEALGWWLVHMVVLGAELGVSCQVGALNLLQVSGTYSNKPQPWDSQAEPLAWRTLFPVGGKTLGEKLRTSKAIKV